MKKLISTTLLSACLLLVAQAQEKITFKLNPEIGKSLPFEMNLKMDMEGPQNVIMEMKSALTMIATQITDQEITYETKYNKTQANVDAGLMIINYDSSREPTNQMEEAFAEQMKGLLSNTLTLKMSRQGKLLDYNLQNASIQGFDKASLEGFSVNFPSNAVGIGESWISESDLPQANAKGKYTYTYTEKTAEGYKVTVKGDITDNSGNNIGSADGYYIFDPKTHYTSYFTTSTTIELEGTKASTTVELKEVK